MKTERKITAEEVIAMNPCDEYDEARIRKNHGHDGLTILELIALDIPRQDVSRVLKRLVAADIAETVLPIFEEKYPDDKRPREAIAAARSTTMSKEERDAAGDSHEN